MTNCSNCFIPEHTYLLDHYYPVGEDFTQVHPEKAHRIFRIQLSPERLCNYCVAYQEGYDQDYLNTELREFLVAVREQTVVVAFSGGKDSLTALFLAKEVLGLKVRCFLYQNGFIPEAVIAQAQSMCQKLQVPLDIHTHTLEDRFRQEYYAEGQMIKARTGVDFCSLCAHHLNKHIQPYLQAHHSHWVILGNKVYTQLSPHVSAVKQHAFANGTSYYSINFLFALKVNEERQAHILKTLEWQAPNLKGYTTNCLIPGFVEAARRQKLGVNSNQGYIEMELRSSTYTRKHAKALLKPMEGNTIQHIEDYFDQQGWTL